MVPVLKNLNSQLVAEEDDASALPLSRLEAVSGCAWGASTSRKESGFTLLELCIWAGVMAVVIGISLQGFAKFEESLAQDGAARMIASSLAAARMQAASTFSRTRVTVDSQTSCYRAQLLNRSSGEYADFVPRTCLGGDIQFIGGDLGPPAPLSAVEASEISFNSRGLPITQAGSPAPGQAIYVSGSQGQANAVVVTSSGEIRVFQSRNGTWEAR